jgi:hypothetical protein
MNFLDFQPGFLIVVTWVATNFQSRLQCSGDDEPAKKRKETAKKNFYGKPERSP